MNVKKLRLSLDMTQSEFWLPLGVSQSAGSRYETESREIFEPVKKLVLIAYGKWRESQMLVNDLRRNR